MQAIDPMRPDIDFGRDELANLHEVLDEMRAEGPVVRVKYLGSPVWLILNYPELNRAFLDQYSFDMSEGYLDMVEKTLGRNIMTMSGDEHRVNRAIVAPPFQPKAVRDLAESIIEPVAHELLDRIIDETEVDLVQAFTRLFPFAVITRMIGIPVEDEGLFLDWAAKLFDFPWDPEGALRAKAQFDAYMLPIIQRRRRAPTTDFLSMLTQADVEGQRLTDEQVFAFLRLLFPAGSDTTYKAGGSLFAAVLADPEVRRLAGLGETEREAIISEALRWQPPTALLPRKATGDVELGGRSIKRGDWVLFGVAPANSDPQVFENPRRFDPSRSNRELITFGRGSHFCLGMHLARRELNVALKVVLERFPDIALAGEGRVEFVGGVLRGPRELRVRLVGAG